MLLFNHLGIGVNRGGDAAWSPADISGLQVMLLADDIVGLANNDPVTTWADSGPNGYDFTSSGGSRPTYIANDGHGIPTVRFVSASSNWMKCNTAFTMDNECTIFVVHRTNSETTRQTIFGQQEANEDQYTEAVMLEVAPQLSGASPQRGAMRPGTFIYTPESFVSTAAATETLCYRRNGAGANHLMRVNGRATEGFTANNSALGYDRTSGEKVLGRRRGINGAGQYYGGDIYALVIYDRALTTDEMDDVDNWLMQKFQPDQFRLDYLDYNFWHFNSVNAQGAAFDGTNYYLSADNWLYKGTVSGGNFVPSVWRDISVDFVGTQTQINGMCFHQGKVWTGGNYTSGGTTNHAWIQEWDPDNTFALVSSREIQAVKGGEGGAWFDVGSGMEYWAIYHTSHTCDRYNASFGHIAEYTLPSLDELYTTTNLYQGACWAVVDGSSFLIVPTHLAGATNVGGVYKWNGTGFTAWQKIHMPTGMPAGNAIGQGNHWELAPQGGGNAAYGAAGDVMMFARRDGTNPGFVRARFQKRSTLPP